MLAELEKRRATKMDEVVVSNERAAVVQAKALAYLAEIKRHGRPPTAEQAQQMLQFNSEYESHNKISRDAKKTLALFLQTKARMYVDSNQMNDFDFVASIASNLSNKQVEKPVDTARRAANAVDNMARVDERSRTVAESMSAMTEGMSNDDEEYDAASSSSALDVFSLGIFKDVREQHEKEQDEDAMELNTRMPSVPMRSVSTAYVQLGAVESNFNLT